MACMEDVLDLYAEPYDPKRPVVNFDETSKQLVAEKKTPIPHRRGRRERFDYEYKPTFPIWLNIPLSKSSAFFKPLSICET